MVPGQGGSHNSDGGRCTSISGNGGGLFSTASNTGNAGEITVTTPTLTMGDGGTISVATEGAGNAGNISLSVSNLTLGSGSQIASSTTGGGAGGTLAVTASELVSISGAGSGLLEHGIEHGECGTDYCLCARLDGCADADDGRWSKDFGGDIGIR